MADSIEQSLKIVAKGGMLLFFGMLFSRATAYIHRLVIARIVGPETYGLFSLALAVIGIFTSITLLGFDRGAGRFTALYLSQRRPRKVYETISTVFYVTVLSSALGMFALIALAQWIAIGFFHEVELFPVLVLMSFLIPVSVFLAVLQRIFRSYKKVKYEVLSRCLVENSLKVLLTLVLLLAGLGLLGVVTAYAASLLIALSVFFYYFLTRIWHNLPKSRRILENYPELVAYSLPLFITTLLVQLLHWTDVTMIGFLMTTRDVGIYSVAHPTSQFALLFYATIYSLFLPVIMSFINSHDNKRLKGISTSVTRWVVISTLPISLFLILMARPLTLLMFGREYLAAVVPLTILVLGMTLFTFSGGMGAVINAMGKSRWTMYNSIFAITANVILNFWLIQLMGINGAAIATAITYAVLGVLFTLEVRFLKGFFPYEWKLLRVFAAGLVAAVPIYLLGGIELFGSGYATLAIKLALFLGIYAVLLFALKGFTEEDTRLLKLFIRKIRRAIGYPESSL